MSNRARVRRMAVAMGKAIAFLGVTQILAQLVVFTALGGLSAKYWSQYDGRGLNEPWFLSSSVALLGIALIVTLAFLKYVEKQTWSYVRLQKLHSVRLFTVGFVVSLVAVVLFILIATITDEVRLTVNAKSPPHAILYLFLMLIGGGALVVQEELIFRGYVLRTLEVGFNRSVGVLVTALLFGLFHIARADASALGILNIFLMGCLLGVVCVRTGSLWSAIGLHFGWNFFLYLFDFPVSGATYPNPLCSLDYNRYSVIAGSAFGPEDSVVVTLLMVLLLAASVLWLHSSQVRDDRKETL